MLSDEFKELLKRESVTQRQLALLVGESQSVVCGALSRDIKSDRLRKYANAIGYDIQFVKIPKN